MGHKNSNNKVKMKQLSSLNLWGLGVRMFDLSVFTILAVAAGIIAFYCYRYF